MGQKCALCTEREDLRDSHIFPEFLYQELYDDQHRHKFLQVSTDPAIRPIPRPKGLYEPLLCGQCEEHLNRCVETQGARIVESILERLQTAEQDIVMQVDYRAFRLFQLSLLWRASVASRQEFSAVLLGPHEERMRLMLLNNDVGDGEMYPCVVVVPAAHKILRRGIVLPEQLRIDGHLAYRVMARGLWWIYSVSSHPVGPIWPRSLTREGVLRVYWESKWSSEFLSHLASNLSR
jgi:hypothetical protein